jgi:3-deoxy-D-manno-octulosonic-acid transferase
VINGYDIAWVIGLSLAAPYWLAKPSARAKVLKAFRERMGGGIPCRDAAPAVLIHAVSLGEINATRAMVNLLRESQPSLHFIITTTTGTGFERATELYGNLPGTTLVRYPLDFSSAITRVLDKLRPNVVVLMELEVWPNFVLQCRRRNIPVLLVNGRLTPGSFRNYRMGGFLVRKMFHRLTAVCAQEQAYADRFVALGAPAERVSVTGTMKFDTAQIADRSDGDDRLASDLGLNPGSEPIWVCGSTGPGEEQLILPIYRNLLSTLPNLRLVIVPRKPERFDEVAQLIQSHGVDLIRRSRPVATNVSSPAPAVILGDTMGELRKFYSLADVVFVGRSLVDLGSRQHGSDMIEPAALAKPVIVGPHTGNFAEVMNAFRSARAMREVHTAEQLQQQLLELLSRPDDARAMGSAACEVVRLHQGATRRHVEMILARLPR